MLPAARAPASPPDPQSLRASDAERDARAEELREHLAAGRLTAEELTERLDAVYAARTRGELAAVLRDMPAPASPRAPGGPALAARLAPYVLVNLVLVVVWAATGAGYFWPMWPLLGWGAALILNARGASCQPGRRPATHA